MTKQIIIFLETLESILASDAKQKKLELSYKASCFEVNELQLTFNKMAKTFNITNKTLEEGKELQRIMEYAEAYQIFKDFDNKRQMGICISKMGAIRFTLGQLETAQHRFD